MKPTSSELTFYGGISHAIRSIVLDISWDTAHRHINRTDAGGRARGTWWRGRRREQCSTLRQFELQQLRGPDEKPDVQPDWTRQLFVHMHRHTNKVQRVVILAICLLASSARGKELDAAWFEANYLPAAEKLQKFYGQCSAKVSETGTSDKSNDYTKATFSFAFDGARRKFDRTIESREDGSINRWTRSIVASPEVSFVVLTKHEGEPLLERVNRSPMGLARAIAQIDGAARDSIYAPFSLLEKPVSQYVKDKDFEIKRVKQDGDRVRLDIHYKNRNFESDGWVVFLPHLQWVIDGWDISLKMKKPSEYRYRVTNAMSYGGDDPVPALTGSTTTTYHPDRTDTNKMVVDELSFAPVPAQVFTLSRYGYDDQIGLPPSGLGSLWFWLAATGLTCLLAAYGLRRVMARRAAA